MAGYLPGMYEKLRALDLSDELTRPARALLFTWDRTADNIGRADALALLMVRDFMSAEYQNGPEPNAREELGRRSTT